MLEQFPLEVKEKEFSSKGHAIEIDSVVVKHR